VCEPPVTRTVEPVPAPDGIPALVVGRARDLVFHLGIDDRRAKVVFGPDRGGDLLAQHHRLAWSVDRDFELRLFVFLDAEVAAAATGDDDLVLPQHGVGGELIFSFEAAIGVGLVRLGGDFLAPRIVDLDAKRLIGER
jgi:hypothetical protein